MNPMKTMDFIARLGKRKVIRHINKYGNLVSGGDLPCHRMTIEAGNEDVESSLKAGPPSCVKYIY